MIILENIDCMEGMKRYPNKSFELAIVDPPYTNETKGLAMGHNRSCFTYSNFSAPDENYITELKRVSKNQIIWGFNHFVDLLGSTESFIFWNKHQNGHFAEGELAWCSFGRARYFDRPYQQDQYNKIHPTQKPVALYKWLLQNYAKQGDNILDTHLGSGSIALACHEMKFNLTGFEIDKDYFAAASKRLKDFQMQLELW